MAFYYDAPCSDVVDLLEYIHSDKKETYLAPGEGPSGPVGSTSCSQALQYAMEQPHQLPRSVAGDGSVADATPVVDADAADGEASYNGLEKYYRNMDLVLATAGIAKANLKLNGKVTGSGRAKRKGPQGCARTMIKALDLIFADPVITHLKDTREDKEGYYQILERIIGYRHPARNNLGSADQAPHQMALLFPQHDEETVPGIVCYLARLLSYGTGKFISPLKLNSWFMSSKSKYQLDYTAMKADTMAEFKDGLCYTRSWTLPIDLNQVRAITEDTSERQLIKKQRAKSGEAPRAPYFAKYRQLRKAVAAAQAATQGTKAASMFQSEAAATTGRQPAVHQGAITTDAGAGAAIVGAAAEQGGLPEQLGPDIPAASRQPGTKRQRILGQTLPGLRNIRTSTF